MDLYDAIEYVEELMNEADEEIGGSGLYYPISEEDVEAIRIILEAAKDKAGV